MKSKIKKMLQYAAVILFITVLFLNVKRSLANPFTFMNELAITEETTQNIEPPVE